MSIKSQNEEDWAAAGGAPESHDSRQTKTGVGSSALHTRPPCRICFPQCANCAVPQTWRKGILGKNTKSIFPAGVYAVPAERQEPGGSGPGGRDTAHGARALRSESFLYFCCCLEGVIQDFCGGEGLLFILETERYQTLHTNPLRCWVTLGPTSCLQAQRDPGLCFGRFPGSRQPLGCWK